VATINQRLRFEVFKRDKFTCQYCGQQAPDVILNCDHIRPLADGGETDLLNLITSCRACNGGKGAVRLTDASALDRQRSTLADLEERRQQIEMMLQWRDELRSIDRTTVDQICDRIQECSQLRPNKAGEADIAKWLRRFTVSELIQAFDQAFDLHLRWDGGGNVLTESWDTAFRKVPACASMIRQARAKPYIPRLLYIQGIIRRRTRARRYNCIDYLEHIHLCGADLEQLEQHAKGVNTIDEFESEFDAWLESIGRPF
jgi:hypothetical protein